MKIEFRQKLENLLNKNSDSQLASYINTCLIEYDKKNQTPQNPFGIDLNKTPNPANQPIPANIGNNISTGWSNPFGGTSWGV
jgi:hypothetical protein